MIRIVFCCLGNICRSTMAQSVFTDKIEKLGLSDAFYIDSMGTSKEEEGNPPHFGTVSKLNKVGIPVIPHRAKQISIADYDRFDFIIAMDGGNIRDLNRIMGGDPKHKIFKFLSFSGVDGDIADPWYTGNFDDTYRDIDKSCDGLLNYLSQNAVIG